MRQGKLVLFGFLFLILGSSVVFAQNASGSLTNASSGSTPGGLPLLSAYKSMKTIHFGEPVKNIEFMLSKNIWAGMPYPEKVKEFPLGMEGLDLSKNVYSYFKLNADKKINASVLNSLEVKLSVSAKWIESNKLGNEDVDVYFYDKNGWTNKGINVSYFGKNSDEYFYIARIPDMGYYAIVEKEEVKVIEEIPDVEEEVVEEVFEPEVEDIEKKPNYLIQIILILIVVLLVVIYFDRKKKNK